MPTPRFLTLDDVAEILNVSWSQAYALVRRKDLIAIQIGGRGQWRIEVAELERFIEQKYAEARAGTVPPEGPDDGEGTAGDSAGNPADGRASESAPAEATPTGRAKRGRRSRA
jgi:excisionase family DNA binding protein